MMARNQPAKRGRKPKKTQEAALAEMMQASGQYGVSQHQAADLAAAYSMSDRRTRAMSQFMQMQESLQNNTYATQVQQEHHNMYPSVGQHNMYAASTSQQQNIYAVPQDQSMYSAMQNGAQDQNMYSAGANQEKNMYVTPSAQDQHMYSSQVQQDQHNMFSTAAAAAQQDRHMYSTASQHQDMYTAAQTTAQQTAAQEQHLFSTPAAPPAQDHRAFPSPAHTRSPHTAHTDQQRMALTSNHILYPNLDMAHVPRTTATYTVPEQLPELSSMQGRTSGYNLRYNARRMNANQATAPTQMDRTWNTNVPTSVNSYGNMVNTRVAHVTPQANASLNSAKSTPTPQMKDAGTQTELVITDDDIQLIKLLRCKRMDVTKLQVLVSDDEYTVTYTELEDVVEDQADNTMVDITRKSNYLKSCLFFNYAHAMYDAGHKMLKDGRSPVGEHNTNGISPVSSPEPNEHLQKIEPADACEDQDDNSGTSPQMLEQNRRNLIETLITGNGYLPDYNGRRVPIDPMQRFPFNPMLMPPPYPYTANQHEDHNYYGISGWF